MRPHHNGYGKGIMMNTSAGTRRFALLLATTILSVATDASALLTTAYAQAAAEKVHDFNIKSKSVRHALNDIGRISGVAVVFSETASASKAAKPVWGSMSTSQAIATALTGTGLNWRFTDANTVTIVEPSAASSDTVTAADGTTVLNTITVVGQGAVTEGSGSYTTGEMSTATGLNLSIRETPQSVSVVTNARIRDAGMVTVEDALANTTGITVGATGGERSNYFARGFQVDNIMVDGLTISQDSDVVGSSTLAMYDRVEVVRGATGLLEGAGNPSASINLVRKRPTAERQIIVTGTAGRWNNYMGVLDAGGSLNAAGTLRARMVTSLQDADTFTQDYERQRQLYYGILEADLTEDTMLTLGGYYNREKSPGADWNGLPTRPNGSFYDFDRSVRSSPSWTYWNKVNTNVFGEIKHQLDNDWVINVKGSYLDAKMDMLGASLYRLDPVSDELQYNIGKYDYHHKQTAFDVNAQGTFDLLGRSHELSVGGNYRRNINDDGPGGWPSEFPFQFDPFNWQQSVDVAMPEFNYMWERQSKEINYGLYATAKLNVTDPLNVFVGGRLSWYETNTFFRSGTYTEATAFDAEHEFTPYVAATYDLNDVFTVYGSVTSIFKPQNYTGTNGALLNPVSGTNYEAGIKGEFLDGRLNASLAAFQIDQKNLPDQLPPCDGGIECYAAAGKVRSRGVEAEVSGLITEDWRVFAGYTYINAKYLEDSTGGKAGDRYGRDKPQHLLTLSTVYTLPGDLNRWRVGASGRFQSAIEGNVNGYINAKQDAYGLLDLMVAYSPTENTDFRLNVYNVFDKYYYKSVGYTDNANLIGAPRSFTVTGTYKF